MSADEENAGDVPPPGRLDALLALGPALYPPCPLDDELWVQMYDDRVMPTDASSYYEESREYGERPWLFGKSIIDKYIFKTEWLREEDDAALAVTEAEVIAILKRGDRDERIALAARLEEARLDDYFGTFMLASATAWHPDAQVFKAVLAHSSFEIPAFGVVSPLTRCRFGEPWAERFVHMKLPKETMKAAVRRTPRFVSGYFLKYLFGEYGAADATEILQGDVWRTSLELLTEQFDTDYTDTLVEAVDPEFPVEGFIPWARDLGVPGFEAPIIENFRGPRL
jgi:hypothetical protein